MLVTLENGGSIECDDEPFAHDVGDRFYWDRAGTHVIKLYRTDLEPARKMFIRDLVGRFNPTAGESFWQDCFMWPDAIISQPGFGVTLPRRNGVDLLWFLQPSARRHYAAKNGPEKLGRWINYVRITRKMAQIVGRLHTRGLCHADLSFKSFRCDPVHETVVLADFESIFAPLVIAPDVLGTRMCMAPELMTYCLGGALATPTRESDRHALATLIYWLLLQRHPLIGPQRHDPDENVSEGLALGSRALFIEDPNDTSNHFAKMPPAFAYTAFLTPAVAGLVTRAFVDGLHHPENRPTAHEWAQALYHMEDAIIPCDNPQCPAGSFVVHPGAATVQCVCGRAVASVPVLQFYNRRGADRYSSAQHYLAAWPGRTLHNRHLTGDLLPEISSDSTARARLDFDAAANTWRLVNLDLPEVMLVDGTQAAAPLQPGQSVELNPGLRILFGVGPQARLAYVQTNNEAPRVDTFTVATPGLA